MQGWFTVVKYPYLHFRYIYQNVPLQDVSRRHTRLENFISTYMVYIIIV